MTAEEDSYKQLQAKYTTLASVNVLSDLPYVVFIIGAR